MKGEANEPRSDARACGSCTKRIDVVLGQHGAPLLKNIKGVKFYSAHPEEHPMYLFTLVLHVNKYLGCGVRISSHEVESIKTMADARKIYERIAKEIAPEPEKEEKKPAVKRKRTVSQAQFDKVMQELKEEREKNARACGILSSTELPIPPPEQPLPSKD